VLAAVAPAYPLPLPLTRRPPPPVLLPPPVLDGGERGVTILDG